MTSSYNIEKFPGKDFKEIAVVKIVCYLIVFALLPLWAQAQSEKSQVGATAGTEAGFTSDRPGTTTGVDILPKGRVQWETGFGYERTNIIEGVAVTTWTLNTSLLRWGISESAELRLQADYLFTSIEGTHANGLSNVAFGTKVKLFDGWKVVPAVSLLGNVFVPSNTDDDFLPNEWSGQMALLFQNELTSWLSLGYEASLSWHGETKPDFFWGFCLDFQVSDRLLLMAEEYNYHYYGFHKNWMELGAAYMLTPRLQLDLTTDIHLNNPKNYFHIEVGVAWQIYK